jgi:DDE_Tnp_1-associated/Transposase DDE domain
MDRTASLLECFATLPDPRSKQGRRYPLPAVLGLSVVAMLAGMTSLEAIAQFGRLWGPRLAPLLGFRSGKTPSKATLSRTFRGVSAGAVEAVLRAWVRGRCPEDRWRHLTLDGKALRGSKDGEAPGVHLLTAYAPEVAAVVGQLRVDKKTNEHKAALQLLGVLPLGGKVVTADAMFTHRDVCRAICGNGGDYLLPVKDNQPRLRADIEAAFAVPTALSPPAATPPGAERRLRPPSRQGARPPRGAPVDGDPVAQ